MVNRPRTAALIVAAGSGTRVGDGVPKQFRLVRGQPLLRHSYAVFAAHPDINHVVVAIGEGQELDARKALEGLPDPVFVTGAATRRGSVLNGLKTIAEIGATDQVL
ncbi:MAG: 2-C-methyl-D-erythritol 4-phosphate cytidylyltransferase, partial [Usitatibacteraceae bacterium]